MSPPRFPTHTNSYCSWFLQSNKKDISTVEYHAHTITNHACSVSSRVWLFAPHGLQSTRLVCPWDSPGKSTGVGCCFLLQGIFPTQASNTHTSDWFCFAGELWLLKSPLKNKHFYFDEVQATYFFPLVVVFLVS